MANGNGNKAKDTTGAVLNPEEKKKQEEEKNKAPSTSVTASNPPVAAAAPGPDEELNDPDVLPDGVNDDVDEDGLTQEARDDLAAREERRLKIADLENQIAELKAEEPPPPVFSPSTHHNYHAGERIHADRKRRRESERRRRQAVHESESYSGSGAERSRDAGVRRGDRVGHDEQLSVEGNESHERQLGRSDAA